jgi:hypothetical protein
MHERQPHGGGYEGSRAQRHAHSTYEPSRSGRVCGQHCHCDLSLAALAWCLGHPTAVSPPPDLTARRVTTPVGAWCGCPPTMIVSRCRPHRDHCLEEDWRGTMTTRNRRRPSSRRPSTTSGVRRVSVLTATLVLAVGIVAAVVLLRGRQPGGMGLPLPSAPAPRISLAATADSAEAGFRALSGRWLRPDGGYILDIRHVDARGKMDAAYLNPRPIPVARAEATRDGSTFRRARKEVDMGH